MGFWTVDHKFASNDVIRLLFASASPLSSLCPVVKIDVVGALRGIPRISGMGASFRDDMGNFLLAYCVCLRASFSVSYSKFMRPRSRDKKLKEEWAVSLKSVEDFHDV
ncbi:hypothetical protein IFM89_019542 [Coptis chinensis]|uniref:Uncharacterized protein n=1 Tax=Coptis chinensis TaxID=261450 RepID=A0A835LS64_9MAGN|nr:hypothetical protein IFM89_019542 [Coptis chinensis]